VPVEQEVKLEFGGVEAARHAVVSAGGRLVVSRRLVDDCLFDSRDGALRRAGSALRLRRDGRSPRLTWKGPVVPGLVKTREEIETTVADAESMEATLRALGYQAIFRAQKYREEYVIGHAAVTVDDTPAGVYVEIEADPDEIGRITRLLGRSEADYCLESYPTLWRRWCAVRGLPAADMLFPVAGSGEAPGPGR
jgi:adenylate cyclase class 2